MGNLTLGKRLFIRSLGHCEEQSDAAISGFLIQKSSRLFHFVRNDSRTDATKNVLLHCVRNDIAHDVRNDARNDIRYDIFEVFSISLSIEHRLLR